MGLALNDVKDKSKVFAEILRRMPPDNTRPITGQLQWTANHFAFTAPKAAWIASADPTKLVDVEVERLPQRDEYKIWLRTKTETGAEARTNVGTLKWQ